MDEQKVTQILKEIFDKYGLENLRNEKIRNMVAKSYIPDMLNKTEYWDENLVLTQAMKSAEVVFLTVSNLTGDSAKRAVGQLEQEAHMRREDAEFVVRCIISARGENPDAIMSDKVWQKEIPPSVYRYNFQQKTEQKQPKQINQEKEETRQENVKKCISLERSDSIKKGNKIILIFLDIICAALLFVSIFLMLDDGIFYWGGIAMPLTALTALIEIICRIYVRCKKKLNAKGFIEDYLGVCIILTIISSLLFFCFYIATDL